MLVPVIEGRGGQVGSTGYLDHGGDSPAAVAAWKFGCAMLGGFLMPLLSSLLFHDSGHTQKLQQGFEPPPVILRPLESIQECNDFDGSMDNNITVYSEDDDEDVDTLRDGQVRITKDSESLELLQPINAALAMSIVLGDFFHNVTDGVFVGTVFILCNRHLAIMVTLATIYQELAQELSDYVLLTRHCHLQPYSALILNFLAGTSVFFGAMLVLALDITAPTCGYILATGAGVYIFIAVGECLPRARQMHETHVDILYTIISIVAGILPIGMVNLSRGQC